MSFFDAFRHRLSAFARPGEYARGLDEEIRFHLDLDSMQRQASGEASRDAANAARRRFGNPTYLKEETRRMAGLHLFDSMVHDGRYLVRTLRRSLGFAAVAIFTLALGIGATTAVLSVVDHVLLRGLPMRDADRVVMVLERNQDGSLRTPSYPTVADWQRDPAAAKAFEAITFLRGDGQMLQTDDGPQRVTTAFVSPGYFQMMAARPIIGRAFSRDEESSGAPVVVLSYTFWQQHFGGDPAALGKTLSFDGATTTVIGVMPAGATYPTWASVWEPLTTYKFREVLTRRGVHVDSRTVARVRPTVDSATAAGALKSVEARLAAEYPTDQARWMSVDIAPIQTELLGNVKPLLLTLGVAAALVLLLACANVANLLLARMSARARELALRSALGASRERVVRQLLTESLVLGAVAGVIGTALAAFAVRVARGLPPDRLPRAEELSIDVRVLGIAAAVSMITVVLCGLWPAWRATRPMSGELLRTGAQGSVGGHSESRLRRALVTVQFALALVLLVGAGLLMQSFRRAAAVPLGLDPNGLVSVAINPPKGAYREPAQALALYDRLLAAVRAAPGVEDAAVVNHLPFTGAGVPTRITLDGGAPLDSSKSQAWYRTASESYLTTMRMTMRRGRWFTEADMQSPTGFVINETLAMRLWPGDNAIGKRITVHRSSQARADLGQPVPGVVIGVVGDVHQFGQDIDTQPEVFVPNTLEVWPWINLVIRTREGARGIPALRRVLLGVDPRLAVGGDGSAGQGFRTVSSTISGALDQRRTAMSLVAVFAGCALVLAAIGMYGVIAYGVTQRTREMGIRKALGATDRAIARLVLRESFALAALGIVLGGIGAFLGGRLIQSMLFQTGAADPVTYVVTAAGLSGVALLASYLPARRATRLDPTIAIRGE